MDCIVIKDLNEFIYKSDLIVANRIQKDIEAIDKPVFTRDIFNKN